MFDGGPKFCELELDYESARLRSPESQAAFISSFLQDRIKVRGEKVAITFSANDNQAAAIYESYGNGGKLRGKIRGKNQADAFGRLLDSFPTELLLQMRLLPFATIKKGGNSERVIGAKEIVRDLTNMVQQCEQGWTIVILTNPDNLRKVSRYQIGGGKAIHFYDVTKGCLPYKDEILSFGGFVERIIVDLVHGHIGLVKDVLKPFQDVLLERHVKIGCCLSISDPPDLAWWINESLKRLFLLPEGPVVGVTAAKFSPSYNLRLYCSSDAIVSALQKPLAQFNAEALLSARRMQLTRTSKTDSENLILSIPVDQWVDFLLHFCQIPPSAVAFSLTNRINTRKMDRVHFKKDKLFPFVVVTPHFLVFGNQMVCTVDDALVQGLLGQAYEKKGVRIDPTLGTTAIVQLMQHWRGATAARGNMRYTPWITTKSLEEPIFNRYNVFTGMICQLFELARTDDILAGASAFRSGMGRCFDEIVAFVVDDICGTESSSSKACHEYWLYLQIATLAYFRGNFFLCTSVLQVLFRHPEVKKLVEILDVGDRFALEQLYEAMFQKDDSFGQFNFKQQVILATRFASAYGPCLLNSSGFAKWMIEGEARGKDAKSKTKQVIEKQLDSIVSDVVTTCHMNQGFLQSLDRRRSCNENDLGRQESIISGALKWAASSSVMREKASHSLWRGLCDAAIAAKRAFGDKEVWGDYFLMFSSFLKLRDRVFKFSGNPISSLLQLCELKTLDTLLCCCFFESKWLVEELMEYEITRRYLVEAAEFPAPSFENDP